MTPVGVPDVRGLGGECRLKSQRIPTGDYVAGESDFVAMITKASPAVKEHRAFALALLVCEVEIVEPERGVNTGDIGVVLLFPVEPPEIDALLLEGMMQDLEVVVDESAVRDSERDILLLFAGPGPLPWPSLHGRTMRIQI
jgi:hypothetical protein